MYDTVVIKPRINAISNNANLIILEPSFNFQTKERSKEIVLFDDGQKCITGAKAFCNTDHFQLTIKRNLNPYDSKETVSLLQFSLPKQKSFDNSQTVDAQGFNKALEALYKNVFSAGFDIDIEGSPVVRFDCAKQVDTMINSKQFVDVFQFVDSPRMKKIVHPGSLLFYSKDQELNMYDKDREQEKIGKNSFSSNVRFEMRNKTSAVCRKKYAVESFIDLKNKYSDLRKNYLDFVQKKFFAQIDSFTQNFAYDFNSVFEFFVKNSKRNFSQNILNYFSFLYLNENNLTADFLSSIKKFGSSRNNCAIIHNKFQKYALLKKQFDSIKNKKSFNDYVHDLKIQFMKAA